LKNYGELRPTYLLKLTFSQSGNSLQNHTAWIRLYIKNCWNFHSTDASQSLVRSNKHWRQTDALVWLDFPHIKLTGFWSWTGVLLGGVKKNQAHSCTNLAIGPTERLSFQSQDAW